METTDYLLSAAIILLTIAQVVTITFIIAVLISVRRILKHVDALITKGDWIARELANRLQRGSTIIGLLGWLIKMKRKGGVL